MVSIPRLVKLTAIVVVITTTSAEAYSHREGAALGLFTHNVPENCSATRKCHATHCDCVGGFFLRDSAHPLCSLTDNGNITAATFDRCTSRLVDCILVSALNAHSDPEVLCQRWGDKLVSLYQNTTDELFEVCKADVNYSLVSSTSSLLLADTVNFTLICSFANIKLAEPATSNPPKFDVCMPTDRTYFADFVPVSQCSGAGACVAAYCSCISGVWNAPTLVCDFPSALPTTSKWSSCLRSVTNCLTLAALDVYVPKASPRHPDPCVAWSVPLVEDFAAYTNASNKRDTDLFRACNSSACEQIYRFTLADISEVCDFTDLDGRPPTFEAYTFQ